MIKFRAWEIAGKRMVLVGSIDFRNKFIEYTYSPYNDSNRVVSEFLEFCDVVLMQSTGLFDKNGKEIFEGDILKCTSFDGCLWCETVSWDSTIAGFATHQNGYDATPIEYITDSKAITIEIIGNIYENPELLEVE